MTTVEVLREARGLIRKGWTRRTYAVDCQGKEAKWWSDDACRFCAIGAVKRAALPTLDEYDKAIEFLEQALPEGVVHIPDFNDAQRFKQPVLALYDRAIALAEQEATP